MRRTAPLLSLLAFFSGCTWIDNAQVEALKGQVDDDGDGVPASADCDDGDPTRSTAELEIWYDGVDEDCLGDDDYDQDKDGYVPTDFVGLTTLDVKGSGTAYGGDCDDEDAAVSPSAVDSWYDGIDSACDDGDDYDQDGDGFVSTEYLGLVTKYVGTSGMLPGGDCDDDNSAIYPNALDAWYDGLDANCDSANDYDQDGDGFVPDEWLAEGGGLPAHDCNDQDDGINPGTTEVYYNGVDDACNGKDDYDQDEDGYVRPVDGAKVTYTTDFATGELVAVAGTGALPGADCDDTDETAHPLANEVYGDATDEDCDGGRDSVDAITVAGYTYTNPHTPIFVEAEGYLYLSAAVEQVATPLGDTWYNSGFVQYWDTTAIGNDPTLVHDFAWAESSEPTYFDVGTAHSFRLFGSTLYGVIGREGTNYRSLAFESYPLDGSAAGRATAQSGFASDPFEDADVYVDSNGWVYGVGCDGGTNGVLTFTRISSFSTSTSAEVQQNFDAGEAPGTSCQFADNGGAPYILTAGASDLYEWTPDSATLTEPSWTGTAQGYGYAPSDIDTSLDGTYPTIVLASVSLNGVYVEGTGISSYVGQATDTPQVASAVRIPGGQYLIAWVNANGTVRMAKGNDSTGYSYVAVNFAESATGVALWVNGSHAMVAVTGATALGVAAYDW